VLNRRCASLIGGKAFKELTHIQNSLTQTCCRLAKRARRRNLSAPGPFCPGSPANYGLRPFETPVKVVLRLPPTAVPTVMIATAMPAAIKPYSMAVAPDTSEAKRERNLRILETPSPTCTRPHLPLKDTQVVLPGLHVDCCQLYAQGIEVP